MEPCEGRQCPAVVGGAQPGVKREVEGAQRAQRGQLRQERLLQAAEAAAAQVQGSQGLGQAGRGAAKPQPAAPAGEVE